MVNFRILFFVIFLLNPIGIITQISDKRLCANIDCTDPISLAKTILKYPSPDKRILSLPANVEVTVYSKSAGSNTDLWGVEYMGKRGYLNKKFLRETKILRKDVTFLVDTELTEQDKEVPSSESVKIDNVTPTQQPYEVVDGTTIDLNPNEISPSVTQESVQPTEPAFVTESPPEATSEYGNIPENTETLLKTEEPEKKDESMMDNMLNSLASFLDSGEKAKSGEDDDDIQDDEDIDDDDDDEDEDEEADVFPVTREDEDDVQLKTPENVISSELPKNDDQKVVVNIEQKINDEEVKQTLEENIEKTPESTKIEEIEKIEDNTKSEEVISKEDSVTLRHLLNEETLSEEVVESSEQKPQENFPDIVVQESVDKVISELQLEEPSIEANHTLNVELTTGSPIVIHEEISSDIPMQEVPMTTESGLDLPIIDDYNVEAVTSNPGKVEDVDGTARVEEKIEEVKDPGNVEGIKTDDVARVEETIEVVKEQENSGFWGMGLGVPPKTIEEAQIIAEGNENNILAVNVEEVETVNANPIENISSVDLSAEEVPLVFETPLDQENSSLPEIPLVQETVTLQESWVDQTEQPVIQEETNQPAIQEETNQLGLQQETEQAAIIEDITKEETSSEEIVAESSNDAQTGGLSGIYNGWFGGSNTEASQPEVVTESVPQDYIEKPTEIPSVVDDATVTDNPDGKDDIVETHEHNVWTSSHTYEEEIGDTKHDHASVDPMDHAACPAGGDDCPSDIIASIKEQFEQEEERIMISNLDLSSINLNLVVALGIIGASVAMFLVGCVMIDKSRRETPLIAKINSLEKALLVSTKENQILLEKASDMENETALEHSRISSEAYDELQKEYDDLQQIKTAMEDQIQTLEKELENSTEVGLELNRMLSDMLSSQNGSDTLIANVEQLQRQLIEQQSTINSVNDTLNLKDTENHELQLELEIKNKKVVDLQVELDKMALNLLKTEEEKELAHAKLENEVQSLKDQLEKMKVSYSGNRNKLLEEVNSLKRRNADIEKNLELKIGEYNILRDSFNKVKSLKNNAETLESLLNVTTVKAEYEQLQKDNKLLSEVLHQERLVKSSFEKQVEAALQEAQRLKLRYDDADKEKLEAQTKLEVLGNYFKEREAELQRELSKQESMWVEKQGEATSTTERIKYIQEELQNCKALNESLKQEIVSQEVELKSQISVLEKKAHESWVTARQSERRLEEAKQEAAQLRNRLTLKERGFADDKGQNRMQSPLEQNGDGCISPFDTPVSPSLLFGANDHLPTSPPIPGLPPFLPPPPGVPFMPPPPGVPGFMPPPPAIFPGDHRPPPLGRMSSPPLNSRYSPDTRYSPYDRNSPSPTYDDDDDDDYSMHRSYSPYDSRGDRRDYKRPPPPPRANGRKKGAVSSGSEHSTGSIDRNKRHHGKI